MLNWLKPNQRERKEENRENAPVIQAHMALMHPAISPLNIDNWCQNCPNLIQLEALAFREDLMLDKLPIGWTSCRTLDFDDARVKFVDEKSLIFAFSYGVLLFVNLPSTAQENEVSELRRHFQTALDARVSSDAFTLRVAPTESSKVEYNGVIIDRVNPERLAVFAETLAQSVAMEYYESVIIEAKEKTLEMLTGLRRNGRVSFSPKRINRSIADVMLMHAEVVSTLHLLDKPDPIWNDSTMDALYSDLRTAFDLEDRFKSIEYKIEIIRESLNIIVDTVRDSRSYRVDFAILAFVGFEVVFGLLNHFRLIAP